MDTPSGLRPAVFVLLIVLVAVNLRPALSSLAPLLYRVQQDLALSSSATGALTTLPVLCLGLSAPLAPRLSRYLGPERTLSLALVLLTAALLLRGQQQAPAVFGGTALAGAAIGIGGTLLPMLVKRELPGRADLLTGFYTMSLCLGGALGAGLSVPLAGLLDGWTGSIASWAVPALLALAAWRALMPHPWPAADQVTTRHSLPGIWTTPLAWQVTLLMGLQSSLAYSVFGWLPTLLQRRGVSEAEAGLMLGVSVLTQIVSALAAPWLGRLGPDQRPALLTLLTLTGSGMLLALIGPLESRWTAMLLLGLGQGGSFSLAMTLLVLRSATPEVAGHLSGMAQGCGYCIAALGPFGIGFLLDRGTGLDGIATALTVVVLLALASAMLAGRRLKLAVDPATGRLHASPARHD